MSGTAVELLSRLPFLQGASPFLIGRLAELVVEREFAPGELILQEDAPGREIYLIVDGRVEVVKGQGAGAMVLAQRGPGEVIGEMALLEGRPRFATVRALQPSRLLQLSESAMASLTADQPDLILRLMQGLSARVRANDLHMIEDLTRKNLELAQAYRELQAAQAALVEKERLEREMELARELQQSILPDRFPPVLGVQCAARARPARHVGGDFYDVVPLEGGCLGLVMADVSGKGMAAALFMALTRSLLRAEARRSSSPREVLLSVHHLILEMSRASAFVTVFYGVLDPTQGTLCYARAGHDYPVLVRAQSGECELLTAAGRFLGFVDGLALDETTVDVRPGDTLVLYTDGMTDVRSPAGELFGQERLIAAMCSAKAPSAEALCDALFQQAAQFQAGADQFDDQSVLVVRLE